jgi:uncharacterized protein YoxC
MTADDLLNEILRSLQTLHGEMAGLRHQMAGFAVAQRLFGDGINALQQDVRMIRAALNDIAKTNVTAGEVEAIHTDINRLNSRYLELATDVEIIKRGQA